MILNCRANLPLERRIDAQNTCLSQLCTSDEQQALCVKANAAELTIVA